MLSVSESRERLTAQLIHTLDDEIGYTSSLDDTAEKPLKDEVCSDSFLHMDTGIMQQQSKLGLLHEVSCIDSSIISGMEKFKYNAQMDMYVKYLIRSNDSTIHSLIVTPRKLSLRNTVLDNSSEVALLTHLTVLDLSCNQLTELDGLIDLVNLSELNISDNMIVSLKPLNDLKNLVRLDASKNSIRKLEFQDTQLVQLVDASFADNHISEIIGICSLVELCTLNLNNNELEYIYISSTIKSLKSFSARNNRLEDLELKFMPLLEFLDLGKNHIPFIKIPDEMSLLSTLLLDNQFSPSLNYDFSACHNLSILNVSSNPSIEKFEGFPTSLVQLYISKCSISEINDCRSMGNLVFLDASNNYLTDVSGLVGCHNLERLTLMSNQISNIYMLLRIVKKCAHLTDLDARFNPINFDFYSDKETDDAHLGRATDECIVKRMCYRSLLIHYSNITCLDGIEISMNDRKSSSLHVSKFKKAMHSVSTTEMLFPNWLPDSKPLFMESTSDFFIIIPNI